MYIISVQSTCTCMCKIAQLHFSSFLRYFFFLSLSLFLSLVLFAENRDREREREREREKMRFYIYILLSLHLHSHVTSFFSFFFILFLSSLFLSLCVCVYVCVCIIVYVNKRLLLKAAPQIEIVIPGSKKEKQFVLSIRTRLSQILFAHCFDSILTRLCPRIKMEQCLIIIKLRNGLAI